MTSFSGSNRNSAMIPELPRAWLVVGLLLVVAALSYLDARSATLLPISALRAVEGSLHAETA